MANKKKAKKPVAVNRKPRTGRLPGFEDMGIKELENLAEQYADVRDQRISLSKREGEMQDDLLALMKKHRKSEYHHDEVHVWVKATEMKVKVKLGELTPAKAKKESADTVKVVLQDDEKEESDEQDEPEAQEVVDGEFADVESA